MRILIDGDATPRSARNICEEIGRQFNIPIKVISEVDREFTDDGSDFEELEEHDYQIASMADSTDIVVTLDYTLASQIYERVLAAINPKGFVYSAANMDELLYQRYMDTKKHQQGTGPKIGKRSMEEDQAFTALLLDLVAPISKQL